MKISEAWLREWVDSKLSGAALAERLTLCGLEVDSIETVGSGLDEIVIAEVLAVEQHPNADRLTVCRVRSDQSAMREIVCGAPNARAGLHTVLAMPGARLANGTTIRRSKLRGVESDGMLCSAAELGLGDDHDGIIELPDSAPVGRPITEYLDLPDTIIDIDVTPNRGDCFSVLGIAREVSAFTGASLKSANVNPVAAAITERLDIRIADPQGCPRFSGRIIRGMDPAATTPMWMRERLRRGGLRAIHPVVDVTNYVLLAYGQPLHGYDLGKLRGALQVRRAVSKETLTLLDDRTVELQDDVLIIADESGPVGLAGIMGGRSTAVDEHTIDVFLEGAFFAPEAVTGRPRRFGLHTDASLRFERGVDPTGQARAIEHATQLLVEIAGGTPGPLSEYVATEQLPAREPVALSRDMLARIAGTDIPEARVVSILQSLGMSVATDGGTYTAIPPAWRFDIAIPEDLIEEIVRIYGYDEIPEITATAQSPLRGVTESRRELSELKQALVDRGYQEVLTYSFVDPELQSQLVGDAEELRLANPLSRELSVMRRSLLPGLLGALRLNQSRQQDRIRLFEVGHCFLIEGDEMREINRIGAIAVGCVHPEQWGESARDVDFFDIKSDLEHLFGPNRERLSYRRGDSHSLHPVNSALIVDRDGVAGCIGVLHPRLLDALDITGAPVYFEIDAEAATTTKIPEFSEHSRFPAVRRDVAVIVDESIGVEDIVKCIRAASPRALREIRIFDIYRGKRIEDGLKSVALGLILQETSRTLTDDESDGVVRTVVSALQRELDAKLRDR